MATHTVTQKTQNSVARPPRGIRSLLALVVTTILVIAVTACTAKPQPSADSVKIPDTAVGAQARWILDEINSEELSADDELEARFDASFFESLTVPELSAILEDLRAAQPWTPTAYEGDDTQAKVTIESEAATYEMSVAVSGEDLMNGLFFAEPAPERTPAASWDALQSQLEDAPYEVSLQVREVGAAEPDILIGDTGSSPIGSIIKLYVLGAVVDAIDSGTLTWESQLTIDADVRSLPSGELQDLPDGSTVTVLEAAQKMMAISDNTATDLLIRAVGKDAVSAALADMGHASPDDNAPLLTTRELFWIGWGDEDCGSAGLMRMPSNAKRFSPRFPPAYPTPARSTGRSPRGSPARSGSRRTTTSSARTSRCRNVRPRQPARPFATSSLRTRGSRSATSGPTSDSREEAQWARWRAPGISSERMLHPWCSQSSLGRTTPKSSLTRCQCWVTQRMLPHFSRVEGTFIRPSGTTRPHLGGTSDA